MTELNGNRKGSTKSPPRPQLDVSTFHGQWVAVHPKTYKVIGNGHTLDQARQSASGTARLEPLLYFVPKSDAFFIGCAR